MPSTCLELKQCSSSNSYTSDGEYWLYPPIFNSHADVTKIKVYCKGMDSDNPTEYITCKWIRLVLGFLFLHKTVCDQSVEPLTSHV